VGSGSGLDRRLAVRRGLPVRPMAGLYSAKCRSQPRELGVPMTSRIVGGGSGILIAAMAAVLLTSIPASGHYLWHEDARDAKGSGVDLKSVRLFRRSDPNRGVVRIRTYEDIALGDDPSITVEIDSRGGPRGDRAVTLQFATGSYGWLCQIYNPKTDENLGACTFGHSDRFWRMTFPWRVLDATRHSRWRVGGGVAGGGSDSAPDAGWFIH
jgi:hypothetical protein